MTAKSTSIETYHDNEAKGHNSTIRARIAAWVAKQPGPVSRKQIAVALGLETSTVSGRVNELLGRGLVTLEKIRCPITGKKVEGLRATREGCQPDLWGDVA